MQWEGIFTKVRNQEWCTDCCFVIFCAGQTISSAQNPLQNVHTQPHIQYIYVLQRECNYTALKEAGKIRRMENGLRLSLTTRQLRRTQISSCIWIVTAI